MSTFLWITLVVLYLTALVSLGLATLRKGHTVLFWVGISCPVLWIIGALIQPTAKAVATVPEARCRGPNWRVSIYAFGRLTPHAPRAGLLPGVPAPARKLDPVDVG